MIEHHFLDQLRSKIKSKNDVLASKRQKWIKANPYYYRQLIKSLKFIIEEDAKVLHVRCSNGFVLDALKPKYGVGIDDSQLTIDQAKATYPNLTFIQQTTENIQLQEKFDYVLLSSVEDIVDLKAVFDSVYKCCHPHTRLIIVNYNYLWNPLVQLAESLKLKIPQNLHNWISVGDLNNMLVLSGYEKIVNRRIVLVPYNIPVLSYLMNRFVARLPFFRHFTMLRITLARMDIVENHSPSVSIIIPCKNEAGNVEDAVKRIPQMGSHTEIIFCDDKSTDGTPEKVQELIKQYPEKDIRLVAGPGICKSENVWTGFDAAKGEILMILDADLTVIPEELPYFYEAITKNRGDFINGSRLVYPMHDEAMRFFNVVGNKFFSLAFSYILDTSIKDTLCGTKVLYKRDYERIKKLRGSWGLQDRWGDYELIFGAAKMNLKHIDLPVHYYERVYGETKMKNRLKNGWIMLKMSWYALMRFKFY
ncbi:MAG: glycosyltransferase [Bacteroidetes bacterium]|nr:glycosyltransferase [Bacteroidota bacterium]